MKHGEGHQFLSFKQYKVLHEANLPLGEIVTQATLHEGYINTTLMRIIQEIHGLKTPYSPNILLQEEKLAKVYPGFSPKEYELLQQSLKLLGENKPKDMERAMETLVWFKESTCPCTYHVVKRGGKQWQLRPPTTVPSDFTLQLPTVSQPKILLRRQWANFSDSKPVDESTTPEGTNPALHQLI